MGFQFPDNCDNAKVPELSEASQSVVNSILSGGAFKNPFGDNLGGISDILNGPEGIGGQLTSLITQFDSVPDVKDVLGGIQSQLGLGLNAGGLLSQIVLELFVLVLIEVFVMEVLEVFLLLVYVFQILVYS